MAAADAALRHAKALGPGRFSAGAAARRCRAAWAGGRARIGGPPTLWCLGDRTRRRTPPLFALAALEILAVQAQNAIDAAGWAVSVTAADHTSLITYRGVDSARDSVSGLWVLSADAAPEGYPLSHYPMTARAIATGSSFIAAVDLDGSDPAETALLEQLGYRAVLAAGSATPSTATCWKSIPPAPIPPWRRSPPRCGCSRAVASASPAHRPAEHAAPFFPQREQGWLDDHTVAIIAVRHRPWMSTLTTSIQPGEKHAEGL